MTALKVGAASSGPSKLRTGLPESTDFFTKTISLATWQGLRQLVRVLALTVFKPSIKPIKTTCLKMGRNVLLFRKEAFYYLAVCIYRWDYMDLSGRMMNGKLDLWTCFEGIPCVPCIQSKIILVISFERGQACFYRNLLLQEGCQARILQKIPGFRSARR